MTIHILGGGVAGYSAAIGFSSLSNEIHLWEKENQPFLFSSSRNSAIARSYESDPYLSLLLKKSLWQMQNTETEYQPLIIKKGLLIRPMEYDYFEEDFLNQFKEAKKLKAEKHSITLPDGQIFEGFLIKWNGILHLKNIHLYLRKMAKQNNVKEHFIKELKNIRLKEDHISEFEVYRRGQKEIIQMEPKDILVNAAGSWGYEIMHRNNLKCPNLIPHKRHMFLLKNDPNFFLNMPVLWDERENFYIRDYDGDLLLSHCDETPSRFSDYSVDIHELHKFKIFLQNKLPFLAGLELLDHWSCLRTFSLDNRPIIGFDPFLKNLFWCAGWGGRGMSMSFGISELVHNLFLEGRNTSESEFENAYTAFRFFDL